jgi:outer membrane protein
MTAHPVRPQKPKGLFASFTVLLGTQWVKIIVVRTARHARPERFTFPGFCSMLCPIAAGHEAAGPASGASSREVSPARSSMHRPSLRIVCIAAILALAAPHAAQALTLQDGLRTVTERGREVAIARAEEDMARESVSLARAPWLPSLDLYAQETWLRYQPAVKVPVGSFFTSQDQFLTYGVRATQLLYDFGKTSSSITMAKENLRAREAGTFRTRNRAALDFLYAYYDLLEADELLKVAREEVVRYEAHKKDAEARMKAGIITRNEVLQADVILADSRQRFLTAENNRSLRASRVNSILLRSLNEPVQPAVVTGTPALPSSLDEAWTAAEKENPDLRDLDARVGAREASVGTVRAEYLPTVFVSGAYEYSENEYQVHQDNWSLVAGVRVNLFAGGATDARVGMAKSEVLGLKMTRERFLDAVRLDAKAAWLDVDVSRKKIEVALSTVAQAEENLRLARLRYKEGVGTATEVTDAVTLVTTAETNAGKANYALKRAEATLLHVMGRDLPAAYDGIK